MVQQFDILIVSNAPCIHPQSSSQEYNFIHSRHEENGVNAFRYLSQLSPSKFPKAIVIDNYMKWMNATEFLERYLLEFYYQHPDTLIYVMRNGLSSSDQSIFEAIPPFAEIIQKPISTSNIYKKTVARKGLVEAA